MAMEIYKAMDQRFNEQQIEMLNQKLKESDIKERKGSGDKRFKYLKSDFVIDTANRIFGFGQWGYKVVARSHEVIQDDKKGTIEFYTADIELSVVGSMFPFPGDGVGVVTSPFTVEMHEKARKEATSDAFKRALRHYGDQFGNCLYDENDLIEGADGNTKSVKDAKQQKPTQQARHTVDSVPPQQLDDAIKQRLNDLFKRTVTLELVVGKNTNACLTAFFVLAGEITGTKITGPQEFTTGRLDTIEAYIVEKEQLA
jgi:DNA repair and recombination protein RAD52